MPAADANTRAGERTNQRLQELRLRDFRCFREQQTARLAPLTLLVGENSTGKTSFLAAVRTVLELARHRVAPDFRAPPYDLGSFHEVAHRHSRNGRGGGAASFGLGFRCAGSDVDSVSFEAAFTLGDRDAPTVSEVTWSAGDVWLREIRDPDNNQAEVGCGSGSWRLSVPFVEPDPRLVYRGFFASYVARALGVAARSGVVGDLQPLTGADDSVPSESDAGKLIKLLLKSVNFSAEICAGAPIRSSPLRIYDPVRLVHDPSALFAPTFLANLHARDSEAWQNMKHDLEEFGHKSGLFDEIFVKKLGRHESEPFQLEVRKWSKTRKGTPRNLIDVGYGVSQVLPLLVELFRHDGAPLFLLEQPEIHLHPSAQAALGTLLCATAASGRQLIVETHSDYILDRIVLDVRDGRTELRPDDVSILYFERDDLDVTIHSLRIDEEGNVLDAPDGYRKFFQDELQRVIDY